MHEHPPPQFQRRCSIRFAHCDPAGIVFYPQYYVLFQGLVEDWFTHGLQLPYHTLVGPRRIGLPTVHLSSDFHAPSRLGDAVVLGLTLVKLGSRSFTLRCSVHGPEAQPRITSTQVLVTTDLNTHRAIRVPDDVRAAMQRFAALPPPSHPAEVSP